MAFESWTALKQKMYDDLATGNWRTVESYAINTGTTQRTLKYRSVDDFLKLLREVEQRASDEEFGYAQVVAVPAGGRF